MQILFAEKYLKVTQTNEKNLEKNLETFVD